MPPPLGAHSRAKRTTLALALLLVSGGATSSFAPPAAPPPIEYEDPAEARLAVRLLADFYRENLEQVHVAYVRDGRPAAATVTYGIFAEMNRRGWPRTRWLSANHRPLNPDNAPRDEFERQAARALRRGEPLLEKTEPRRYRAVFAVPFNGTCLKCHWGDKESEFIGGIAFAVPLAVSRLPSASPGVKKP